MNNKMLFVTLIILMLLSGCVGNNTETQPTPTGQTSSLSVEIKNFAFNPETITISKGQTVTWTQMDGTAHTIKSVNGAFPDSPSLSKGQTYSYTFNDAGTFEYYCSIHPSMKGKVMVE